MAYCTKESSKRTQSGAAESDIIETLEGNREGVECCKSGVATVKGDADADAPVSAFKHSRCGHRQW